MQETLETMDLWGIGQSRREDTLPVGADEADGQRAEHVAWLRSSYNFTTVCQRE